MRLRAIAAAVVCLCCAMTAPAQNGHADSSLRRLVHAFDFEEARFNNFESLPRHWYAIGRRADTSDPTFMRHPLHQQLVQVEGYPHFCDVRFDKPQQEPGNHALLVRLSGGNAGAFLGIGTLPVVPGSDYLITARVRTEGLHHASATLVAYFIDGSGSRIDDSIREAVASSAGAGWQDLAVKLPGEFTGAAWIGIQVEVRQPERRRDSPLGSHQVVLQDIAGQARFDDVNVWQLPRVLITSQSRVNVIRYPEQPELLMQVRDVMGKPLTAQATVYNHRFEPVAQEQMRVGGGEANTWRWTPDLPGLGWYLVDMRVHDHENTSGPVAGAVSAIIWAPEEGMLSGPDAGRFILDAQDTPVRELKLVNDVLAASRLRALALSAWTDDAARDAIERARTPSDVVIQEALARGYDLTLSLNPIPAELATSQSLDVDQALPLFGRPESAWRPYLEPIVLRYGQRVLKWRLGSPTSADAFFLPNLGGLIRQAKADLSELSPQPRLVVPWRIFHERRRDVSGTEPIYWLDVSPGVAPEQLRASLDEWLTTSPVPVALQLRSAPADQLVQHKRVEDLILRMIHAWEAGAWALALERPWAASSDREVRLLPDPLLGVFCNVAQRLAGRRAVGRLDLGPGIECVVFASSTESRGGMLAAWNRSAPPGQDTIDVFLGPSPVAIDAWGNRTPLSMENGRHQLRLSTTPVFIVGIDAELALLRAHFKFGDPFIESKQMQHQRTLTIYNPWSRTISGHMTIIEPRSWQITPQRHFFSIPAGEMSRVPFSFSFPVAEVAGIKRFVARFDFTADVPYVVDLSTELEVGLRDVSFDASLTMEPGSAPGSIDAVVTSLITNRGREPLSLYAFAAAPGYPRQERIISRLLPGQSIVRRFRFEDAAEKIGTSPIRAGLRETEGPAVLNRVLYPPQR